MTTTYFLNCVMGNVFGTQTEPPLPSAYYIGLSSTEPAADGTGVTEPTGGGYARVQLTSLSVPDAGAIENTASVEFEESTDDWGTMTHYVVYDAPEGGNLLLYNALEKNRVVQSENQVRFKTSALAFTLESAS